MVVCVASLPVSLLADLTELPAAAVSARPHPGSRAGAVWRAGGGQGRPGRLSRVLIRLSGIHLEFQFPIFDVYWG